jgi:pyruvate,water dikinase
MKGSAEAEKAHTVLNLRDGRPAVAWFHELPEHATPAAGGKGASLSRMVAAQLPVPPGFVVCSSAFEAFLEYESRAQAILSLLDGLDVNDSAALDAASGKICEWVRANRIPTPLEDLIRNAHTELAKSSDGFDECMVAVRSSAVAEDGDAASFAGQQETFLNVRGADAVIHHVRECWASFFSPRALFYRAQKGTLTDTGMAVVVQEMVQAEKSGVMFTIDPIQKRRDYMVIEAVWGLGEGIVSGLITPDHYVLDRDDGCIIHEFVAVQPVALMYDAAAARTAEVELPEEKGSARVLSDEELHGLRKLGLRLENYFGKPQDVEWCIRGSELLLLQSRPITTL